MVFLRLLAWHRKSGASFRTAVARAWAKYREPDPFFIDRNLGNNHALSNRTDETPRTTRRLRAGPVRDDAPAAGAAAGE